MSTTAEIYADAAPLVPRCYRSYSVIALEKLGDRTGPAPAGTVFEYTYKSKSRDQALQAASKMLEFQYKGESRLNWREIR